MEQLEAGLRTTTPDGLDLVDQLRADPRPGRRLVDRGPRRSSPTRSPRRSTTPASASPTGTSLADDDRAYLDEIFAESIFPVLTPLAVDPAHPFPYISNLSLNLAVTVRDPSSGDERFARVKVPPLLPRFVAARPTASASCRSSR